MYNLFVSNALPGSILMGAEDPINFVRLTAEQAAALIDGAAEVTSAVGHADTAALFSAQLGREVAFNRISLPADLLSRAHRGQRIWPEEFKGRAVDSAVAAQLPRAPHNQLLCGLYSGPRLPEGSTTLPEGAEIQWVLAAPMTTIVSSWMVGDKQDSWY